MILRIKEVGELSRTRTLFCAGKWRQFFQTKPLSTMTMEASDIFSKFQNLWRAGTNARLNFECRAGQVWMSLHVHLPNAPPQQQQQHHRRRPGPSRLRRRARRAEARERTAEKAVESDNFQPTSTSPTSHVAEQVTIEENAAVEKIAANDDAMHPQPLV